MFWRSPAESRELLLVNELFSPRAGTCGYWVASGGATCSEQSIVNFSGRRAYECINWIREKQWQSNKPARCFLLCSTDISTAEGPLSEVPRRNIFKVGSRCRGNMRSKTHFAVVFWVGRSGVVPMSSPSIMHRWTNRYLGCRRTLRRWHGSIALGRVVVAEGKPVTKHPRTFEMIQSTRIGGRRFGRKFGNDPPRLANWLTSPQHPWFAVQFPNRVWAQLMGSVLVEPVDDFRAPPP